MKTTSFLHSGSIGDVWASIPAMREFYKKTGSKVDLYLVSGQKAFYYEGATHPTTDPTTGSNVMLNDAAINMMIPLLMEQEFISSCAIWKHEKILVDLNKIRDTFVNMPYHSLSKWYFYVYPDLTCNLANQYIFVPDSSKNLAQNKIIITRSERYLNPNINYKFIKKYEKEVLFVGTELEYKIFTLRYNLSVERLIINNFLELAQALKQCKFHISNQTQAAQISEGLKTPRIIELCSFAPNVDVVGENAFEFYSQDALEMFVRMLMGEGIVPINNGFPLPPPLNVTP